MGSLLEEIYDELTEPGCLVPNLYGIERRHFDKGRVDIIEENENELIFDIERHKSADGYPTNGRRSAFMVVSINRYTYRGKDDISETTMTQPELIIDEDAFLERELDNLSEMGIFDSKYSSEQIREELATLSYERQIELYDSKQMNFENFLDQLAILIFEQIKMYG